MTTPRRLGSETSQVRSRFVDAAEALLGEMGEQGISARQVAARAGLKTQLLYYYFKTMDDLLLAVVHKVNEQRLERFRQAVVSPEPLRALWEQMSDPASAALAAEMMAVARHRETVRTEINAAAERFRAMLTAQVARLLPPPAPGSVQYTPAGVVMIAAGLARMMVNESSLGLTQGHAEALEIVGQLLGRFTPVQTETFDPSAPL
jgi:TetR/AcrR family transcriptional regulator